MALLCDTLASSRRQFFPLFHSPPLWVTQRAGAGRGEGVNTQLRQLRNLIPISWLWAHESDICPLRSILPSMRPGERTRYRTPRFYKHCTSCVEKRAESASWAASPCGLRARSLTSQAPSSQGLRAVARATPQQPTGPGDLLLRYCQRTSIISAATVRWAGPWRDGRNQGGALINTAVFVSGHTQESPVTFACKAWLTSVSGGRSLGLKDSARSSGMAATMEERTIYTPFQPKAQFTI